MLIRDIMKKPIVIKGDVTLEKASSIFSSKKIGSLIVIKGEKVVGIITEDDLVKNFGKKRKVSEVMTKNVITISPDKKLGKAVEIMKENGISVLPVVDDGRLIGVLDAKEIVTEAYSPEEFFLN